MISVLLLNIHTLCLVIKKYLSGHESNGSHIHSQEAHGYLCPGVCLYAEIKATVFSRKKKAKKKKEKKKEEA